MPNVFYTDNIVTPPNIPDLRNRVTLDNAGRLIGCQSIYLANRMLDHVLGLETYTPPSIVYVGLWTSLLTKESNGITSGEVMALDYQRVAINNSTLNFPLSGMGVKVNGTEIAFGEASSDWGVVTYMAILDADKDDGGNILFFGNISTPTHIRSGDQAKFIPQSLVIRVD